MNTTGTRILPTVLALSLALGLTACGGKDEKTPATQVAAKVNAEEISVHQINFILGRSNTAGVSPEQAPLLRREILEKLVDQQLAVEQAVDKKLDRSPDVVMAVDAARREILARAYIDQLTAAVSKPTTEEAKAYYSQHPQLFAERRVYNIQEIVLANDAAVATQVREMLAAGKPMEEIAKWLKGKDIKFAAGSATRPAEDIPLDLLPKIHALKDGQGAVIETAQNTIVMRLMASQSAPVPEAAALQRIQEFIANQRGREAAVNELKQLRAKAKITYSGEFATGAGAAPATPAAPAPVTTAPVEKPATNAIIEKGIAGLK